MSEPTNNSTTPASSPPITKPPPPPLWDPNIPLPKFPNPRPLSTHNALLSQIYSIVYVSLRQLKVVGPMVSTLGTHQSPFYAHSNGRPSSISPAEHQMLNNYKAKRLASERIIDEFCEEVEKEWQALMQAGLKEMDYADTEARAMAPAPMSLVVGAAEGAVEKLLGGVSVEELRRKLPAVKGGTYFTKFKHEPGLRLWKVGSQAYHQKVAGHLVDEPSEVSMALEDIEMLRENFKMFVRLWGEAIDSGR